MAKDTGIETTNSTWNPWQGCHKVSEGCRHCYMYREKMQYGQDPNTVVRSSTRTFNGPLRWKDPALVFTCSWSDFFIEEADPWRAEAWEIVRNTPHLTYQIYTKRPQLIPDRLPAGWDGGWPNVWLIVSCENQTAAYLRIPQLLQVPARVYGVSAEPLLGPIDFTEWLFRCPDCGAYPDYPGDSGWRFDGEFWQHHHGYPIGHVTANEPAPLIDWIITGSESGSKRRELQLDWVRGIRDQCLAAGVPFFLKQLHVDGRKVSLPELDGWRWTEMPAREVAA